MPELPEVETTRRTLLPALGKQIVQVQLRTPHYVTGRRDADSLLEGCTLTALQRQGKELLMVGRQQHSHQPDDQPTLGLHLGMTGSLCLVSDTSPLVQRKHVHITWHLDDQRAIVFHDPRKFGGVWSFRDVKIAQSVRFAKLGPDALLINPDDLFTRLHHTRRCLKVALLDQQLVAGLGNIYVDETLFRAGVSPRKMAHRVSMEQAILIAIESKKVLHEALDSGGSTLRNYVNGDGQPGAFQMQLRVYGRGGQPCLQCNTKLHSITLAGRTTVYCPQCQRA